MIPAIGLAAAVAALAKTAGAIALAQLADRVVFFLAIKALLTVLIIAVLPIVLKNVFFDLMQMGMNLVDAHAPAMGELGSMAQQFTGLTAWLLEVFQVPQCISIFVSALQLHLFLKIVPFSPVK